MVALVSDEARRKEYQRLLLELHGRAQRALVAGSVLVLALTGLPQKFDSLGMSQRLMDSVGGIEALRFVHHISGSVLIFAGFYHFALVLVAVLVFKVMSPLQMIPDAKDFRDALQMLRYFLGLRQERVAFDRPSYFQKIDYWVIVWGLAVMGISGLLVLFPVRATHFDSGEAVLVAMRVHSDGAILVMAWLLVVHRIYAGLAPTLFSSRTTIPGRETPRAGPAAPSVPELAPRAKVPATTGGRTADPTPGALHVEGGVRPPQKRGLSRGSEPGR